MPQDKFMLRAIEISRRMMEANAGGPFGAVVVKDGRIIGEGHNKVTTALDPTAHAEVVAIREACKSLGEFSLRGAEIYTSCEPCPMCLSAIYWARIDHIYYANDREDAAAIGFDDRFLYDEVAKPLEARALPISQLILPEAKAVFSDWMTKPDKVPY